MTVVLAPDKFKGSLTAREVAANLAAGLAVAAPGVAVVATPVADGGDGTLDAALSAGFRLVPVAAAGPTGAPVTTGYAERDGVAVIELADVSGLRRLPGNRFAPLTASSHGTGQLIRHALDAGCHRIVVGIGGSACTDGGAGIVEALGGRLSGATGPGGAALAEVTALDLSGLHPRLGEVELVVACDVDNPLLGPRGAAAVYGPQKGATSAEVAVLEAGLTRWAAVVTEIGPDVAATPGTGAAGGVGFATLAVLGGGLRSGIDLVLDLIGFDTALAGASLVVTGEGSLDEQTLAGKAPAGVAARAKRRGIPAVAVAGRSLLPASRAGFDAIYALTDLEPDPRRCLTDAAALVARTAHRIAADWL